MCRTHCDGTPVQMVFVAKLSPVRCIKMRISALLPILNVNKSLSQSNNGLIVCHWYWLIFTQTLHVYSCHICWAILTHKAWGYHGFLPKPKTSSAQNQTFKLGDNICIYHAQLQVVLSSFWTYSLRLRNVRLPLEPTGSIHADIVTCFFCYTRHARRWCALWLLWPPHAAGATPLFLIMQCHLCRFRFFLFHMSSLLVCQTNGNDCCQWRQGNLRQVVATCSAQCLSRCTLWWASS